MEQILFGTVGRIIAGDSAGFYVKVVDDAENTGGFLILTSDRADMTTGFDNWVETREAVAGFFAESNWEVAWQIDG
ncbi:MULTISPECIES: hypothetical protein [Paraburkholderia]|jgi:hypothetical protein|uniref:hypothetical protein n=1 Tax=Paraburkholderia TaxID=1822464 RepID=UPI0006D3E779|nr:MULTISPECIES: hypothetical protein [Paraburkholderia]ALP66325.1 hypothetical protein AN416_28170 [Paraburkholderia caribensis]AMV45656.1 hypothetical protein ATN79_27310 [Paraburkholderia caribensis]AUT54738.1 hypothetical protein C2L66_23205 [Paraburkholderia caribensis]